jgi:hypothetical protein
VNALQLILPLFEYTVTVPNLYDYIQTIAASVAALPALGIYKITTAIFRPAKFRTRWIFSDVYNILLAVSLEQSQQS